MFKYFNCFFSSFFRTLGRIIVYILLGLVFSTILSKIDVHADSIKGVYSHGYINGTNSFLSGMDEGNFSNYKSLSPGVEPTINLAIEDFTLSSENYLVVMTYCTTTTNYINVVTPQYDVTNAKLTGNYGTNNNLGLCRVGDYDGALFQGVFGVSKLPNYESFQLKIWGGTSYTYNTFVQIVDVSLYYDTPEIRNSFITNINSNKMIDNQNQIKNKLDELQGNINGLKGSLDDINSSITDSSSPNLDGLKNTAGWLPEGPIDSILNLPLTLLNSLTTNLSKSCTPVELPLPFIDNNLTLPCLSTIYSQIDGLGVWINSISVIASAFILFQYLMNLYKWVDDTLSFRENNFIDNWTGV